MAYIPALTLTSKARPPRRVQFVCDVYVTEVHAGVVDFARSAGWTLIDGTCFIPSYQFAYDEPSDGILSIVVFDQMKDWLAQRNCPVVRILRTDRDVPYPAVEPDSVAVGARAAEHFLSLGAPTPVFYRLCANPETTAVWEGFSSTFAKAGRSAHVLDWQSENPDHRSLLTPRHLRWEWLCKRLSALPRPLAVFVEDDRYANDLYEAARILNWDIPRDLAVLGVDNRPLVFGKLPVPLSSVDTNLYDIGWTAASLLNQILDGQPAPANPILVRPGRVAARESTATFVCDHPGVSTAVNYLRHHFREQVLLPDIAKAAGMSVRSLQTTFKEHIGRPISEESTRLRLECACELLRSTDLKLESVAHESGLGNAKYLCRVFRDAFDQTPAAYRESAKPGRVKQQA